MTIKKTDRVRHKDETLNSKYGIMEIWEIKNGFALCRYGDYYNLSVETFKITDLIKE